MCRGRSIFRAALLAAVLLTFLLPVTAWAEEGPQFQFILSVDGETEKQVQSGDTIHLRLAQGGLRCTVTEKEEA